MRSTLSSGRIALDTALPLLWRDSETVQFGLYGTVQVRVTEVWQEHLLSALSTGIREHSFDVIAHGFGAPREEAREMLAKLRPLLRAPRVPPPPVWVSTVDRLAPREDRRLRDALSDAGLDVLDQPNPGSVAVVLVGGVATAARFTEYMRKDTAHLPVSLAPNSATVGPLILPGVTPCLACRDLAEVARDSAWPLLVAQMLRHHSPATPASFSRIANAVRNQLTSPEPIPAVHLFPDGESRHREIAFSPDCLCRERVEVAESTESTQELRELAFLAASDLA